MSDLNNATIADLPPTFFTRNGWTEMKRIMVTLGVLFLACSASATAQDPAAPRGANAEQEILDLSRTKWRWMAERQVDSLAALFDDQAVFVHMGGSWGKEQEIDIIGSGRIHYKHAEIFEASVRLIGRTAILLNRIRLDAVVGGNEVTNPFMVTEVYVQENGTWRLGSLSFTRLMTPGDEGR